MSSTGIILKKRKDVEFYNLLADIKKASVYSGLEARIDSKAYDDNDSMGSYTTGNVADTYEDIPEAQQWLMYIYSEDWGYFHYGDINENEEMIRVVFINDVADCSKILLDFLFEYFKLNPKDYFWTDGAKWHYTYEDIMEIKKKQFDPDWCNKDPHADK